ncbi:GNAT family N-acetyltransferase [Uliginosibacterium gangwonense]|uniref:GNAT family N-acetyltransferase n=1 Tax=Uliginosibacterium gangwonense TaxID=392736 RepID=UPI0003610374|nr:GNAT family N-acetyltransferase [Uliginosibacterium gangwonense]
MADIRRIDAEQTLPIRHAVLWPHKPLDYCRVAEDAQGEHWGAFVDGQLVCVASLFADEQGGMRLRKFATLTSMQGQGIGSALLAQLLVQLRQRGVKRFWCDARRSACNLYAKFGLQVEGEGWVREDVEFVRMSIVFESA